MNRHLWLRDLGVNHAPAWPCPVCRVGFTVLRPGSLVFEETVASKREHNEDYWGPELISYRFTAWAECTHASCKQAFSIAGYGSLDQIYLETEDTTEWVETFTPRFVSPAPILINVPGRCPSPVREQLKKAFELYWSDSEACANRLRATLEGLLTHLGVPTNASKEGKEEPPLSLHRRIELYVKEAPQLEAQLMALKWLGNSGSHGRTVSKHDLLDALELLEYSLEEMLEKRSSKIAALAAKLTNKHKAKR